MPQDETSSDSSKSGRRIAGPKRRSEQAATAQRVSARTADNALVSITDESGHILSLAIGGLVGLKRGKRTGFTKAVAQDTVALAQKYGVRVVEVKIGRRSVALAHALRRLKDRGLEGRSAHDVTTAPLDTISVQDSVIIRSTRPAVLDAVKDFAASIGKELDSDEAIVNALSGLPASPTPAHLQQLRANAELRVRFMLEVPLQKSAEVTQPYGWKAEGRVFGVPYGGADYYPAFQFSDDGQPSAAMREILGRFAGLSPWQIALWFFAPNAWLGNEPPMNVLQDDPDAVLRAAGQAVEPIEV